MLRGTPASFFVMAAGVPLGVLLAWAELRLPALVVSEVTGGQTFLHAALAVGALLVLTFLAVGLRDFCKTILEAQESRYRFYLTSCLEEKSMAMFYQTYEKKQTRDQRKRAEEASYMMNGKVPLCQVPNLMTELIRNALCYALFGTILSRISPLLLVLLTLAALVNLLCVRAYNRYEYASRGERTDIGRRLRYVSKNAADFAAAKDIRIYGMATWLRETFSDLFRQDTAWSARLNRRLLLGRLVDLLVILLRDGGAYALLLVMAVRGELRPDEFVLYFSAISGFATFIGNMISAWNEMQTASLKVSDYRQFMELPDTDGTGTAHAADHREHAPEITFDHVSFAAQECGAQREGKGNRGFNRRERRGQNDTRQAPVRAVCANIRHDPDRRRPRGGVPPGRLCGAVRSGVSGGPHGLLFAGRDGRLRLRP